MLKDPTAWVPVLLSVTMLAMLLTMFFVNGIPTPEQNKDEGVAAHLFQIWLVLEVVLIPIFAAKWLPRAPKQAFVVLAIQIAAVVVACSPVFYFKL